MAPGSPAFETKHRSFAMFTAQDELLLKASRGSQVSLSAIVRPLLLKTSGGLPGMCICQATDLGRPSQSPQRIQHSANQVRPVMASPSR